MSGKEGAVDWGRLNAGIVDVGRVDGGRENSEYTEEDLVGDRLMLAFLPTSVSAAPEVLVRDMWTSTSARDPN